MAVNSSYVCRKVTSKNGYGITRCDVGLKVTSEVIFMIEKEIDFMPSTTMYAKILFRHTIINLIK